MSEIDDKIQEKCLAFGDRVIKLNDYLLEQAASSMSDGGCRKAEGKHHTSYVKHHTSRVPVHLHSVAALANQLLRSGRFSSTAETTALYKQYEDQAARFKNLILCGRLADYKYYNMDQAIISVFCKIKQCV